MEIKNRLSPRVKELIEQMRSGLQKGILPAAVFHDEELFQAEVEKIFARNWNFLAHESEIPEPGDYVLRYVVDDRFVVVRDENGEIRVFLDACPHRGAAICRAEKGNSSHFRCPYHGWTFNNRGDLIGTPAFKDAYRGLEREEWGLLSPPRIQNFHGFIFVSLEEDGPTFDESLSGMKWYLDMIFSLQDDGMEVLGEPQRWIIKANWKQPAENFSGDDYHLLYLHRSTYDIGVMPIPLIENMKGYHIQAGNGNAISFSIDLNPDNPGPKFWAFPEEVVKTFNFDNLSQKQFELARGSRVSVGTIFPNTSFLLLPLSPDPENIPPTPLFTWRVWRPLSVEEIEVWDWFMMYKNVPDEFKQNSLKAGISTFGIAGTFEMDDAIPWESISKNAKGYFAKKNLSLNFQMGMEGMSSSKQVEDWPFPGVAYYPRFEEGNHRHMYRRYINEMLVGEE